ncbi:hypothetical protein AB0H77_13465 [Streptomyces sp. NPDC050844]|uniref:glycosyl hydrolase family 95 catalytic domain-containing protein n=1 Tax=Streptomyces sp. NPDC050844 TaxID=3155790 RepID=UPI0034026B33
MPRPSRRTVLATGSAVGGWPEGCPRRPRRHPRQRRRCARRAPPGGPCSTTPTSSGSGCRRPWYEGPYLGNGFLGSGIYAEPSEEPGTEPGAAASAIRCNIQHSEVQDHRPQFGSLFGLARLPQAPVDAGDGADGFDFLEPGADGKLHLPATYSPEYGGNSKDCNYDLMLLAWGCRTLLDTAELLGVDDELAPRWREVGSRLAGYPTDANGYMIGADIPFAKSHRHYSHMLAVYPLYEATGRTADERALIEKSLAHWVGFEGALQGYTFTGAASMSALLGKGEDALKYLGQLMARFIQPTPCTRSRARSSRPRCPRRSPCTTWSASPGATSSASSPRCRRRGRIWWCTTSVRRGLFC